MRAILILTAMLATPALAQNSHCAALPASAQVAVAGPGDARTETRAPRAACYTSLGLTTPRSLPAQNRPASGCPGTPTIASIIAIRGRNLGWQDVTATVPRAANATIEHLRTSGGRTPAAEDPARQDCFAFDCRLVRLTLGPDSPNTVPITFATPGNAATATVTVSSEPACPGR